MLFDFLKRVADPPNKREKNRNDVQYENAEMFLDHWYELQECVSYFQSLRAYRPGIKFYIGRARQGKEKIDKITDLMMKEFYKNYERRSQDTATLRSVVDVNPVNYVQHVFQPKKLARKLLMNGFLLCGAPLLARTHTGQVMCEGIRQVTEVKSYMRE